jgi:hypothetical protein
MRRSHRLVHRAIWPLLVLLIGAGLTMALIKRPPPEPPAAADEAER